MNWQDCPIVSGDRMNFDTIVLNWQDTPLFYFDVIVYIAVAWYLMIVEKKSQKKQSPLKKSTSLNCNLLKGAHGDIYLFILH